jgi:hypothetical protein
MRIDEDGRAAAPVLSYNVPDPTSYPGRNYILLKFAEDPFAIDSIPDVQAGGDGANPADRVVPKAFRPRAAYQPEPVDVPIHDPAPPTVDVEIAEPADGLTILAGEGGTILPVSVRVIVKNTDTYKIETVRVLVNDAAIDANYKQSSGRVHTYTAAVHVQPGAVAIWATATVFNQEWHPMASRRVNVVGLIPEAPADKSAPVLILSAPPLGYVKAIPADPAAKGSVEVRGSAVDPDSKIKSAKLIINSGGPIDLQVAADGSFHHEINDLNAGRHEIIVRVTNDVGIVAETSSQFVVSREGRVRQQLALVEILLPVQLPRSLRGWSHPADAYTVAWRED